jgi:hypothetical protein
MLMEDKPNYYATEPDWLQSQWTARDSRDTNTINDQSYVFLPHELAGGLICYRFW